MTKTLIKIFFIAFEILILMQFKKKKHEKTRTICSQIYITFLINLNGE